MKGFKNGLAKVGASWYIKIKVNGKHIVKSFGPDKKAAELALAEVKKQRALARVTDDWDVLDGLKPKYRPMFEEVAEQYLSERVGLKPSTLRGYGEILKNHILPAFGRMRIDQITEEKIASFQSRLVGKVSAVRVNNIVNLLRYILKVSVRRKLISDSPADNVNRLAEGQTKIDPLTEDELAAVLGSMDQHYRSFYLALAWTGARPGELLALTFEDLDFNRNEIRINKGRVRGQEGLPKTESSNRIIPMLDIVRAELLALKGSNCRSLDGHVFTNKKSQPINRHMDRQWRTALKKAGVRHRPSYQLRHTFASMCLQRGIEPGWVARVLGHSNLETTFRNYGRFINNAAQENERTLRKLGDSFAERFKAV